MGNKAKHVARAVGIFGFALTVAACTGDSGTNDGAATSGNETSGSQTVSSPAQVSPIDEYFNLLNGTNLSPEARIQRMEAENAWREDFIANCMTELGFDYWPNPQSQWFEVQAGEPWLTDDPSWLAEFGFGAVNRPGPRPGEIMSFAGQIPGGEPDQNLLHRQSLTESELEAYYIALNGPENPYRPAGFVCFGDHCPTDGGPDEQEAADAEAFWADPANWGCYRQSFEAQQQVIPQGLPQQDEFAPLFAAIDAFRANLATTSTDADRDWAACMSDAGYSGFARRPNFNAEFQNELAALTDNLIAEQPELANNLAHWPLQREDAPEVEALFQREVATALADLECRQSTDFDRRQQADIYALENQFINDNRAAFNALRDAVEQLG